MQLVQFLDCNDTLGTCCNDYGLVGILDVSRKLMNLIQLIVPIILIVMFAVQLTNMVINPEDNKLKKGLYNKFIAAVIVFMIPIITDAVLKMMPEQFSIPACWEQAKVSAEVVRSQNNTYISINDNSRLSPVLPNYDSYKNGSSDNDSGSASTGTGQGSATGKAIVSYAKQFVGKRYVWGGTWNGELPYTGTDCSGFVQGVYKHFGISLPRDTYSQWAAKSTYTLVNGEIKAGDLVMYDGHVGILTGNGNEIVHAKGRKWGIVVDSDYRKCSSHAILGIMRINGVN